ncbi:hypothetical protein, partial [Thermomonospora sp. CIF 1]
MVSLIFMSTGLWATAAVFQGFQLSGSGLQQVTALLIISVVVVPAVWLASQLVLPVLDIVMEVALEYEPPYRPGDKAAKRGLAGIWKEIPLGAIAWMGFLAVSAFIVLGAVSLVVGSTAVYLAVRLCGAFDLPVQLAGLWSALGTYWLASVLGSAFEGVLKILLGGAAALLGMLKAAEVALVVGGLLLAERLFAGVRLESGPHVPQWMALTVVAVLFSALAFQIDLPGLRTLSLVVCGALGLWLLSWLSTWMEFTLHISGFWTFVGTACLLMLLTGPIRLIKRSTRQPEP